jgi:hypothetical protein
MTDIDLSEQAPDQPPGIDQDSHDMPEPGEAASRVLAFVGEWGDGLIDHAGEAKLFSRDLAAIGTAIARLTEERDGLAAVIETALTVTDDMRSVGWHPGKTVPALGEKLYEILATPAAILATRDAEKKAEALEEALQAVLDTVPTLNDMGYEREVFADAIRDLATTPQQGGPETMLSRIADASKRLSQGGQG